MDEPLRPTADVIEAALSAYDTHHADGSPNEDGLDFIKIMTSNERLRAEIHAAAEFVGKLELRVRGSEVRILSGVSTLRNFPKKFIKPSEI
jgi:hypothetical protein